MGTTSAEYVRRFREKQRRANPREPNWSDIEGRLRVVEIWLDIGKPATERFINVIRAVAVRVGMGAATEPPEHAAEPPDTAESTLSTFDNRVQELVDNLPARSGPKFRRCLDQFMQDIHSDVKSEIDRVVNERVRSEQERLKELQAEARAELDAATIMRQGITPIITQDEYNKIRGLLHPDKHPGDDRYHDAFIAFNRLGALINPNIPKAILRKHGWENFADSKPRKHR